MGKMNKNKSIIHMRIYIYTYIYIYILVNYNDLTAASLESLLIKGIIPQWS